VDLSVGILLWPQFPLLSLAGLCDALRHAADLGDKSRQVRCAWKIIGSAEHRAISSCGIEVAAEQSLSDKPDFDYLAVIGGLLPALDSAPAAYVAYLRQADTNGIPIIGICTGSFVLAKAGLLNEHLACVHPFHVGDWRERYPELPYTTHCDYIIDGKRITCAGGISIIELTTELVRRHCGPDRAAKVVHQMSVTQRSSPSHIGRRLALGYLASNDDAFSRAVLLMEKNIQIPLEVAVIANLLHCSTRQLERIFKETVNLTPSEFYRQIRLKYARWLLLRGGHSVQDVAHETGFADASHFVRHFQKMYGVSPGQLKRVLMQEAP